MNHHQVTYDQPSLDQPSLRPPLSVTTHALTQPPSSSLPACEQGQWVWSHAHACMHAEPVERGHMLACVQGRCGVVTCTCLHACRASGVRSHACMHAGPVGVDVWSHACMHAAMQGRWGVDTCLHACRVSRLRVARQINPPAQHVCLRPHQPHIPQGHGSVHMKVYTLIKTSIHCPQAHLCPHVSQGVEGAGGPHPIPHTVHGVIPQGRYGRVPPPSGGTTLP